MSVLESILIKSVPNCLVKNISYLAPKLHKNSEFGLVITCGELCLGLGYLFIPFFSLLHS